MFQSYLREEGGPFCEASRPLLRPVLSVWPLEDEERGGGGEEGETSATIPTSTMIYSTNYKILAYEESIKHGYAWNDMFLLTSKLFFH